MNGLIFFQIHFTVFRLDIPHRSIYCKEQIFKNGERIAEIENLRIAINGRIKSAYGQFRREFSNAATLVIISYMFSASAYSKQFQQVKEVFGERII